MAAVWEQTATKRLTGMTHSARHLHQGGRLRSDVSMSKAQDVLWGFISPALWELLRVGTTSLRARDGRNAYRRATFDNPDRQPQALTVSSSAGMFFGTTSYISRHTCWPAETLLRAGDLCAASAPILQ